MAFYFLKNHLCIIYHTLPSHFEMGDLILDILR